MTTKEIILQLLQDTQRKGMDKVTEWLQNSDFFFAPASTLFHGNYQGGLADHSLNVYRAAVQLRDAALKLNPDLAPELPSDSVTVCSLLHDVCKANIYKPIVKKRLNGFGKWEDYTGYTVDYNEFPLGHGEKSVIILLRLGLVLTDAEIAAIRWHMTAWDLPFQSNEAKSNINAAKEKYPLCALVQLGDGFASSLMEKIKK